MKLLSLLDRQNFSKIYDIELILIQIIFLSYYIRKNPNPNKEKIDPFFQSFGRVIMIANERGININNIDKNKVRKYIKNKKQYINNVLDFYEKKGIYIFPIYLSLKKSQTCLGFVFRILNKYSNYKFQEEMSLSSTKNKIFESKFYEYMNILEKNNILIEIDKFKDAKIGDIIIYMKNNLEYTHIGFFYNNDLEVLSKFGHHFLYLTPINNNYLQYNEVKIFRVNDISYYENFKNKFIPLIERIKMDKNKILKLIEKFEKD